MKVEVLAFEPDDLAAMNIREHEAQLPRHFMLNMLCQSQSWTLVVDGKVILCGGAFENPFNAGHYNIFLVPSIYVENYSMIVARKIRRWFAGLIAKDGFIRAETVALPDDLHNRWLSFLGMKKEGYLRKAFGEQDYELWGFVHGN